MKRTFIKLNKMPVDGKKPKGLDDNELVILTTPDENIIMDVILPAGFVSWYANPNSTHYIVLSSQGALDS